MSVRAVIIDDEQNNIHNLQYLLQQYCPQVNIVGTAQQYDQAKALILEQRPNLLFLDIQMPDKNGFELLQSLPYRDFEVIFVTAFDQYGIQAIKFSAIDYLLKPINIEELQLAVNKVLQKRSSQQQNERLENLMQLLQQQKDTHRIALTSLKETRFVNPADIIRCESANNYTSFFFQNGEKIIASKPIFEYEELLKGYGFLRSHQSHLVNKKHVRSWVKEEGGYLLLDDGSSVPVSRQKKEEIKASLEKN